MVEREIPVEEEEQKQVERLKESDEEEEKIMEGAPLIEDLKRPFTEHELEEIITLISDPILFRNETLDR